MGPVGLLIEAVVWSGMRIDQELRIWQRNEEPIDILRMPYQVLKVSINRAVTRARNNAEYYRDTTNRIQAREIDREASQVDKELPEEEQGYVRSGMIGSTLGKQSIANINEDVDGTCNYCKQGPSTPEHIKFACKHFEGIRKATDAALEKVPIKYLTRCIQCGIAPAMKLEGDKTYWGMNIDPQEDDEVKKLIGYDMSLHVPGDNAEKTEEKERLSN